MFLWDQWLRPPLPARMRVTSPAAITPTVHTPHARHACSRHANDKMARAQHSLTLDDLSSIILRLRGRSTFHQTASNCAVNPAAVLIRRFCKLLLLLARWVDEYAGKNQPHQGRRESFSNTQSNQLKIIEAWPVFRQFSVLGNQYYIDSISPLLTIPSINNKDQTSVFSPETVKVH